MESKGHKCSLDRLKLKAQSLKHKASFCFTTPAFGFLLFTFCFLLFACANKSEKQKEDSSPKFQQYYVQGEKLYIQHCSNCHQTTGSGLGLVYPPLNKSDYLENNFEKVICLIRYGVDGELMVNGKIYNQKMHGIPALSDLEIAEIATYIYNTWEHQRGMVDVSEVSAIQSKCNPSQR
jgi:mono/diheme cytochrome c family protein